LKIAYFINHYPKVSHSFIRREILALERQGFEVQRLALHGWRDPLPDAEDQLELEKTRYVFRHGSWALLIPTLRMLLRSPLRFFSALRLAVRMSRGSERPLAYHLVYLAEAAYILPHIEAFGAERLHAHFGTNSTEVSMLARALGGPPYSFTIHGPHEFEMPMGLEEKIHRSDFVVAISQFGRSQLYRRACFEDWPKIKVVHCGLERAFYEGPVPPLTDTRRLVCVGRLCEAKGQLLLVEAAARLSARGVPFELVLAGDGPMRPELERLIARLGLSTRVRITGWVSSGEVREEILAARALVLPTFAEGLPVVLMEAMALRRPVITTYVAGIPELVRDRENGWMIPAGSIEELSRAIADCLTRPVDELRRMGDAAYDRVVARHSIDLEVAKLAQLFRATGEERTAKGMARLGETTLRVPLSSSADGDMSP
jgi:colanic acid/amylovoran biosynthesis glycosyltransferase